MALRHKRVLGARSIILLLDLSAEVTIIRALSASALCLWPMGVMLLLEMALGIG